MRADHGTMGRGFLFSRLGSLSHKELLSNNLYVFVIVLTSSLFAS